MITMTACEEKKIWTHWVFDEDGEAFQLRHHPPRSVEQWVKESGMSPERAKACLAVVKLRGQGTPWGKIIGKSL